MISFGKVGPSPSVSHGVNRKAACVSPATCKLACLVPDRNCCAHDRRTHTNTHTHTHAYTHTLIHIHNIHIHIRIHTQTHRHAPTKQTIIFARILNVHSPIIFFIFFCHRPKWAAQDAVCDPHYPVRFSGHLQARSPGPRPQLCACTSRGCSARRQLSGWCVCLFLQFCTHNIVTISYLSLSFISLSRVHLSWFSFM